MATRDREAGARCCSLATMSSIAVSQGQTGRPGACAVDGSQPRAAEQQTNPWRDYVPTQVPEQGQTPQEKEQVKDQEKEKEKEKKEREERDKKTRKGRRTRTRKRTKTIPWPTTSTMTRAIIGTKTKTETI